MAEDQNQTARLLILPVMIVFLKLVSCFTIFGSIIFHLPNLVSSNGTFA